MKVGHEVSKRLNAILNQVEVNDPVCGVWAVNPKGNVVIYTDASNEAKAVVLMVDGVSRGR